MELKDYLSIIARRFWLLVACVIIVVAGVYVFTVRQPESWDGSLMLNIIKKAETSQTNNYQYDKFYSIQASGMFADTIVSWVSDPDSVLDVYKKANVKAPEISITNLAKILKAKKVLPASVQINYSSSDQDVVEPILKAAGEIVKEKTLTLQQLDSTNNFEITDNDPVVLKHPNSLTTNIIIGLVAGILLGLMIVFAAEYFKPSKK